MSFFKRIELSCFRNFQYFENDFNKSCNVLFGDNGTGKTNILEAISLFDKGNGFRNDRLVNIIKFQSDDFSNYAEFFSLNQTYEIKVFSQKNNNKFYKKILINDDNKKESLAHLRSLLSFIYFLPEMERLFISSPSYRRNFLDRLIFSSNKNYNSIINNYKKAINERQLLLKQNTYDENWIEKLERNIVEFGSIIYKKRISHILEINKIVKKIYSKKNQNINFELDLLDNFLNEKPRLYDEEDLYLYELKKRRNIDYFTGGCSIGPHREDIIGFEKTNKLPLSQLSTGQQKTIVISIIIAQSTYLISNLNFKPIILLDEICSHLDDINRELLLYLVNELKVQVFMTGTQENFFSFLSTNANYYNINNS